MEYETIKNELLKKKDELEIRVSSTRKHITHADGPPNPDFAEQAVERQNDEVIYGLNESAKTELIQVKKALERIENGEYGICQECGREIPMERLKAIPYTSYCVECLE